MCINFNQKNIKNIYFYKTLSIGYLMMVCIEFINIYFLVFFIFIFGTCFNDIHNLSSVLLVVLFLYFMEINSEQKITRNSSCFSPQRPLCTHILLSLLYFLFFIILPCYFPSNNCYFVATSWIRCWH